eukprot:m.159246 g.159246  ORF g.159246 m.159246 type:complete len:487 (-) comp13366_c4_seq3:4032-5492(-)
MSFLTSFFKEEKEEFLVKELLFEDTLKAFHFPSAVVERRRAILHSDEVLSYSRYCVVKESVLQAVELSNVDTQQDRALGAVLGMIMGDALGAPLEFSPVCYGKTFVKGFDDVKIWHNTKRFNKFHLKPGQWTDDGSMGLCLIDSLLLHEEFDPLDLRLRFLNWWELGYNNAFGHDVVPRRSIGLGGSIGASLSEFTYKDLDKFPLEKRTATRAGSRKTSGNGSIMRMCGVPIRFAKSNDVDTALDVAYKQSKTTHQGDEAAECVRLMTLLIMRAINHESNDPNVIKKEIYSDIEFSSPLYSVMCLAKSKNEEEHEENQSMDLRERQWDWKNEDFRFAETRAMMQPGYIGSYSMDGLAMALHCVWTCDTFTATILKAVNMCGDADTVGSIAGQLAGSLYGRSAAPEKWRQTILHWDPHQTIEKRTLLLFNNTFQPPEQYNDERKETMEEKEKNEQEGEQEEKQQQEDQEQEEDTDVGTEDEDEDQTQ